MPQLVSFLWDYANPLPRLIVESSPNPAYVTLGEFQPFAETGSYSYRVANNSAAQSRAEMFGGDWYDRIHYQFLSLELGNLTGTQQTTFWVWNAFRKTRRLESIVYDSFEGLTLSGQSAPPLDWAPLEQKSYNLSISLIGPATIAATFTFDWDAAEQQAISVTGARTLTWSWEPNWGAGLLERLEWKTDVLQAYMGEEQRRSVRRLPRRSVEFQTTQSGTARRVMEAVIWEWGVRTFLLPLWFDGTETTAGFSIGATSISVVTTARGFAVGQQAILMTDWDTYEIVEVSGVSASSLTLVRGTLGAWPQGTRIYPARLALIDQQVPAQRFSGTASTVRVRFLQREGEDYTANAGTASHNGYPVLELAPNWSQEPGLEYARKLQVLDTLTGGRYLYDEAGIPITRQRMRWTFPARAGEDSFRRLLYALRGQQGAIYVPTWTDDITVVELVGSGATAIDVEWIGYTKYYAQAPGRKDIRVKLKSGAVYYRGITASSELTSTVERLTISSSFGVEIPADSIESISFMSLCRLDSDAVEFSWFTGDVAEVAATMRSFNHGV